MSDYRVITSTSSRPLTGEEALRLALKKRSEGKRAEIVSESEYLPGYMQDLWAWADREGVSHYAA